MKCVVTPALRLANKKAKILAYMLDNSCSVHVQLATKRLLIHEVDLIGDLRRKQVKTVLVMPPGATSIQVEKFDKVVQIDLENSPPSIHDMQPLLQYIQSIIA